MTIRDLTNHILDLPAWTLIVLIPIAAFGWSFGTTIAGELWKDIRKR